MLAENVTPLYPLAKTGLNLLYQYFEVLAPVLVSAALVTTLVLTLWKLDGHAPLVDAGVVAAGATLIYIALPAVFFALSGMTWTMTSDRRLFLLQVTPQEWGAFLWLPTSYLAAFCATYLVVRKADKIERIDYHSVEWSLGIAIFLAIAVTAGWRLFIEYYYGVNIVRSNAEAYLENWTSGLPLIVVQVTQHMFGMENLAKLAGVVWLVSAAKFNRTVWLVLILWFAVEAYSSIVLLGPRTYFATLIIAGILAFHATVHPLRLHWLLILAPCLLIGVLAYGYLREGHFDFSSANEFQILIGTPMQLRERLAQGDIDIPVGVYFHELLQFIPQQLLPIQKIDPSDWYVQASGINARGGGFMFGVVSQSLVGLGWIELLMRGAFLAAFLSLTHRLYVAKRADILVLIGYIWLCCTIYYSYRASTFYWLSFAVFRLMPVLAFVATSRWIIKKLFPPFGKQDAIVK